MASKVIGHCRICGTYDKLSFEHVPPRSAFNDEPILFADVERLRAGGHPDDYEKGAREQQKGAGAYTLCDRCNSTTGGWYAPAYMSFAKQGMNYLRASRSAGRFHLSLTHLRQFENLGCCR